jgi:hypothetical protein
MSSDGQIFVQYVAEAKMLKCGSGLRVKGHTVVPNMDQHLTLSTCGSPVIAAS